MFAYAVCFIDKTQAHRNRQIECKRMQKSKRTGKRTKDQDRESESESESARRIAQKYA